jgi:hypothetical protein
VKEGTESLKEHFSPLYSFNERAVIPVRNHPAMRVQKIGKSIDALIKRSVLTVASDIHNFKIQKRSRKIIPPAVRIPNKIKDQRSIINPNNKILSHNVKKAHSIASNTNFFIGVKSI